MLKSVRKIITILSFFCATPLYAYEYNNELWSGILNPATIIVNLYVVEGSEIQEVKQNMLRSGPVSESGYKHYAAANWYIKWNWNKENGLPLYSATLVESEYRLTLPVVKVNKLRKSEAWNSLFKNMVQHELKHLRNGLDAKNQIETLTSTLVPSQKPQEVNKLINKIIANARREDLIYDKSTGHGLSEGI